MQASLTSPEALAALRNLAKTNPQLYQEITGTSKPAIPTAAKEELAFSDLPDDSSDIPVAIICKHILFHESSVPEGFVADDTGALVRTGSGENINADAEIEKTEVSWSGS